MINKIKKKFCRVNIDFILLLSISFMPVFLCFNRCFNFTINTFVIPFYIITLVTLVLNIKKILKLPKKILVLFLLFFVSSIVSVLISKVKVNSLFGTWNLYGVIGYLSFASIFFSAIFLKRDEFIKLFKINAVIGFVLSIVSFINLKFELNLFLVNNGFNGPFYHFNHFAIYLLISCLCSIFMIFYKNKIIWYLTSLVLIYAIIYNNTFGVYLALLFAIILIFIKYIKTDKIKVFYILLLFILLSVVVNNTTIFINNHSTERRAISNNFNTLKKDVQIVKNNANNLKSDIKNDTKTSFDEEMVQVSKTVEAFEIIENQIESVVKSISGAINNLDEIENKKEFLSKNIKSISAICERNAAATQEVMASVETEFNSSEEMNDIAQLLSKKSKMISDRLESFNLGGEE